MAPVDPDPEVGDIAVQMHVPVGGTDTKKRVLASGGHCGENRTG